MSVLRRVLTSRPRRLHGVRTASCLATFALAVAMSTGCGGGESGGRDQADQRPDPGAAEASGRRGGRLVQLGASDVDFLDPGKTYYTAGFQVAYATQRPLYGFAPGDDIRTVPDLADGPPRISTDRKRVTVRIRSGVRFAPPVDREVRSDDVKYAIERFFSANVAGPYPGYFSMIEGAPAKPTRGVQPVSGIEVPDHRTIVFRLRSPQAVSFAASLVLPATAPVPREYARRFDARTPSTYAAHVVASGPYMVRNDASGKLTGYRPGNSITLVRNPNWDRATDDRPAHLNEILLRTNASDAQVAARQVLDGDAMVLDANPPAAALRDVVTKRRDQYDTVPAGGFRFLPLNTTVKPFDNLDVRKAVLAGVDREALRKARGGRYVGTLATHFLPPGIPGHEEAGGADGPAVDYLSKRNERGDLALAAKYFKKAGYSSGRYEGDEEILMLGGNADPGKAEAEVAKAQFEKLGFKVRLRLVPFDALFTQWCQVPRKKVAVCTGTSWFKDFLDPQPMLEPLFKGSRISPDTGNSNVSQLDDQAVDRAMDRAALLEGEARNRAWGEVDKMIVQRAAALPFLWDNTTLIRSKDVRGAASAYYGAWDLSSMSLTG